MTYKNILLNTIVIFLLLSMLYACREKPYLKLIGSTQGTYYQIIYQDSQDFQTEIDSLLNNFDNSLSIYNEKSLISRINRNEEGLALDSTFVKVFLTAQAISHNTGGAFDITVAPLVEMWGFYFKDVSTIQSQKIDSLQIDSLLNFVGYKKIKLINNRVVKDRKEIRIDVNALAQGYSVDIVSQYLEAKGVKNYLVEIGGEVKAKGVNASHLPWRIGIEKPEDSADMENRKIFAKIRIADKSVATSGNYRKYYVKDGKKYAHTINPKTGYPVEHNLLSATIIAKDCIIADAYATACMVLGLEKALTLIEEMPDIEGFFIFSNSKNETQTAFTKGFNELIEEIDNE